VPCLADPKLHDPEKISWRGVKEVLHFM